MCEVSKEQFYGEIFSRRMDVHPTPRREETIWRYQNQEVFGRSSVGYASPHNAVERFYLNEQEQINE